MCCAVEISATVPTTQPPGKAMKYCPKCDRDLPLTAFYRYRNGKYYKHCKSCHNAKRSALWHNLTPEQRAAEWQKEKRRPSKQVDAFAKQRRRAARIAHKAMKAGRIVRATGCEKCGVKGKKLDLHHDRYDRPEVVRQLCRKCHSRHHRQAQ